VGGALRAPVRFLAGFCRRTGAAVPGLRAFRERLRQGAVSRRHEEYLLAFSCKTRELCPSCAARRAAATAVLLREEVLEEVGHAQWVFVMPKMLRPYFLHHRKLLGGLARAAWERVRELMVAATGGEGPRPGMVAVVQTAGDLACGNAEANREPADFALHGSNRLLCGGVFHGNKISKLEVLSSRVTVRKSRDPASVSSIIMVPGTGVLMFRFSNVSVPSASMALDPRLILHFRLPAAGTKHQYPCTWHH
jgi:hypothetical protein